MQLGRISLKNLVAVLSAVALVALLVLGFRLSTTPDMAVAENGSNSSVVVDDVGKTGLTPSIDIDSAGNPVIAYQKAPTLFDVGYLKILHCGDPDCSSGNSITTPASSVSQNMSITLDSAGNPVVAYHRYSGNVGLSIMRCNDANCAGDDESDVVVDATAPATRITRVVLDSSGNPVIAYYTGSSTHDITVIHCGNSNCTSGNSTNTIDLPGVSGEIRLELNAAGFPIVAYSDNLDIDLVTCTDANCASYTGPATVTSSGSSYFDMLLDSSGHPTFALVASHSSHLRILRCGNEACSAGNVVVTPYTTPVDVGSIVVDSQGRPVVSFQNANSPLGLQLLACLDSACTTATASNAEPDFGVDGGANLHEAMALDAGGLPVIAYQDSGQDLRVVRCVAVHCGEKGTEPTPLSTVTPTATPCATCALDFSLGIDYFASTGDECDTSGGSTTCVAPLGSTLHAHAYLNDVGQVPAYDGLGVLVAYSGVSLTGTPDSVWPGCVLEAPYYDASVANTACSIGLPPSPPVTYTGKVAVIDFSCDSNGTLTLVHGTNETLLLSEGGQIHVEAGPDETLTIDCVPPAAYPGDTDGDGCPDTKEMLPSPATGGQRNFLSGNDYFNPTHDGLNRIDDIVLVLGQYFIDSGDAGYNPDTDRTLVGPNAWNLGAPDGLQRIADIVNILKQYFHDCS